MANMQPFETRSNLPVNTPRLNFVQAVAFLADRKSTRLNSSHRL